MAELQSGDSQAVLFYLHLSLVVLLCSGRRSSFSWSAFLWDVTPQISPGAALALHTGASEEAAPPDPQAVSVGSQQSRIPESWDALGLEGP